MGSIKTYVTFLYINITLALKILDKPLEKERRALAKKLALGQSRDRVLVILGEDECETCTHIRSLPLLDFSSGLASYT